MRDNIDVFGLRADSLHCLQHFANTSFRLDGPDGHWLAKVHDRQGTHAERIRSEQQWVQALSGSLTVPIPRPTDHGDLLLGVTDPQTGKPVWLTVNAWLPGRPLPQHERRVEHFAWIGRSLARMHRVAETWTPPDRFDIGSKTSVDVAAIDTPSSRAVLHKAAGDAGLKQLDCLLDQLRQSEKRLPQTRGHWGVVHGDASFGNILVTEDEALLIDFDLCSMGYYLMDLAVVLAGPWSRPGFDERRAALLAGYREVRPLSDEHAGMLPWFQVQRTVGMVWSCAQALADSDIRGWLPDQLKRARLLAELLPD
ncbi:MAG: phosphotransferase [Planctomycetota bacterium]